MSIQRRRKKKKKKTMTKETRRIRRRRKNEVTSIIMSNETYVHAKKIKDVQRNKKKVERKLGCKRKRKERNNHVRENEMEGEDRE